MPILAKAPSPLRLCALEPPNGDWGCGRGIGHHGNGGACDAENNDLARCRGMLSAAVLAWVRLSHGSAWHRPSRRMVAGAEPCAVARMPGPVLPRRRIVPHDMPCTGRLRGGNATGRRPACGRCCASEGGGSPGLGCRTPSWPNGRVFLPGSRWFFAGLLRRGGTHPLEVSPGSHQAGPLATSRSSATADSGRTVPRNADPCIARAIDLGV
jgi:hypothetical protein